MASIICKFEADDPKKRTDGVTTPWRLARSNASAQAMTKANSRSLDCDEKIKEAFQKTVSWLRYHLPEDDFKVFMNKETLEGFHLKKKNGHVYFDTLEEVIKKTIHPRRDQDLKAKTKIVNSEEIMRLCNMLWEKSIALPFPTLESESRKAQAADTGSTEEMSAASSSNKSLSSSLPMPKTYWDVDTQVTARNKRVKQTTPTEVAHEQSGSQQNSINEFLFGP
ncbi:hypothetical protein QFC21_005018 [Naganishia friedmannii]|uniref:Uncharacterized protein n=1 Tax=Naganishia friedmannii TaxID=89922 RepID=A0ACC2VC94_9TREE|nr:hypothetical protein QFC21_005018 [Naganishia friedmannii]